MSGCGGRNGNHNVVRMLSLRANRGKTGLQAQNLCPVGADLIYDVHHHFKNYISSRWSKRRRRRRRTHWRYTLWVAVYGEPQKACEHTPCDSLKDKEALDLTQGSADSSVFALFPGLLKVGYYYDEAVARC